MFRWSLFTLILCFVAPSAASAAGYIETYLSGQNSPHYFAAQGNDLYFSENGAHRVKKIDLLTGAVTVVAGTGTLGSLGDGGLATAARLNGPSGLAIDPGTNTLYIADNGNHKIRAVDLSGGNITSVAGTSYGNSGDAGPGLSAQIGNPLGLTISGGVLYIAASAHHRIRALDLSTWIITRVAGTGSTPSFAGDGGLATLARLNSPQDLMVATDGDLIIADKGNLRLRKFTVGGNINTYVGSGTSGDAPNGTAALSANLWGPQGLAAGPAGAIYFTDADDSGYHYRVRKLSGGNIDRITGGSTADYTHSGDLADPSLAQMYDPRGLWVDSTGNTIMIAVRGDNRLRRIDFAGTPPSPTATPTPFSGCGPGGNNVPPAGSAAITGNVWVRQVTMPGAGQVATVWVYVASAGGGQISGALFDNGGGNPIGIKSQSAAQVAVNGWNALPLAAAQTVSSGGLYWVGVQAEAGVDLGQDATGANSKYSAQAFGTFLNGYSYTWTASTVSHGLYAEVCVVAPTATRSSTVLQSPSSTVTITASAVPSDTRTASPTLADSATASASPTNTELPSATYTPTASPTLVDSPSASSSATPSFTQSPAASASATQTPSFSQTSTITLTSTLTPAVTPIPTFNIYTLAGDGASAQGVVSGAATAASLEEPHDVAVNAAGDVYFIDGNQIKKVDFATGQLTFTAGTVTSGSNGHQTLSRWAGTIRFDRPQGLALASNGDLFVADTYGNQIRKIQASDDMVSTIAGTNFGEYGYTGEGNALSVRFAHPTDLAYDEAGQKLYVCDWENHRIRCIDNAGNVTTVAGTGTPGYFGDGGQANVAQLSFPTSIALDGLGNLYIYDSNNLRVRRMDLATGVISLFAGTGASGFGGDGGSALSGIFQNISLAEARGSLAWAHGALYVSDGGNKRIRRIYQGNISTVAGYGDGGYSGDGIPATTEYISGSQGLAAGPAGSVVFVDRTGYRIRQLAASGFVPSPSTTHSHTPTVSATPTVAVTATASPSFSATPSVSPTVTMTPTEAPCISQDLGNNAVDANNDRWSGYIFFQPASLPGAGTVYSIMLYAGGLGAQVRVGLYADNGSGRPGSLLTQSLATSIPAAHGWVSIAVPGVALTPGNYFVAIEGNPQAYLHYNSSAGTAQYGFNSFVAMPPSASPTFDLAWNFDVFAVLTCPGQTPSVTSTITLTSTMTASPSFSDTVTATPTRTSTITTTATASPSATVTPTSTYAYFCNSVGNTAVGGGSTFVSSNTFVAQSITVGTLQRLTSISLYGSVGGSMVGVGLYADNGSGRPGTLVAQAEGAFGPGWNSIAMPAVDVSPGIYWLTMVNQSTFQPVRVAGGAASAWKGSFTYDHFANHLPAQWVDALNQSGGDHFSFYATFCDNTAGGASTPTPTPITCATGYVGNQGVLSGTFFGANNAGAIRVTVTADSYVNTMRVFMGPGTGNIIMAIYTDAGASPGTLIAQAPPQGVVANGWNTASFPSTYLVPGQYWLATWAANTTFRFGWPGGQTQIRASGNFGAGLPNAWSSFTPGSFGSSIAMFAELCPAPVQTYTATGTISPTHSLTPTVTQTHSRTSTISPTALPQGCITLGDYSVGSQNFNTFEDMLAIPITLGEDRMLTSFQVNIGSGGSGQPVKAALYTNAGGTPGTLMFQAQPVTAVVGWNSLPLTATTNVSFGSYWIVVHSSNGNYQRYETTGPAACRRVYRAYSSGLPTTFPVAPVSPSYFPNIAAQFCDGSTVTSTITISTTHSRTFTRTISPSPTTVSTPGASCPGGVVGGFMTAPQSFSLGSTNGYQFYYPFTASANGQVSTASAYLLGSTGMCSAGIYTDNGLGGSSARPVSKLIESGPLVTNLGWNNFSFLGSVPITSGTKYWIAVNFISGSPSLNYGGGSGMYYSTYGFLTQTTGTMGGGNVMQGWQAPFYVPICPAGTFTETPVHSDTVTTSFTRTPSSTISPSFSRTATPSSSATPSSTATPTQTTVWTFSSTRTITLTYTITNTFTTVATPTLTATPLEGSALLDGAMTDGNVYALESNGSKLYMGGTFFNIAPRRLGLAAIDTASSQLTTGLPSLDAAGTARRIVPDPLGGYYVGGFFTSIGGQARSYLARVNANGTVDMNFNASALITGQVLDMILDGERLIVAGGSTSGLVALNRSTGLGQPGALVTSFTGGSPQAVFLHGRTLFLGGTFTAVNGQSRTRLAAIDADSQVLLSFNGNADNTVTSLESDGGDLLFVGGRFANLGGSPRTYAGAFNASTFALDPWAPSITGGTQIEDLAIDGANLYIGGNFTTVNGSAHLGVAGLSTATAATLAIPSQSIANGIQSSYCLAVRNNKLYIGGWFHTFGGVESPGLASVDLGTGLFDSTLPHGLRSGSANNIVYALSFISPTKLAIGGDFKAFGGYARLNLGAYDTATGQVSSFRADTTGGIVPVRALALSSTSGVLWVGGDFSTITGTAKTFLGAVNATTGVIVNGLPAAAPNGQIYALTLGKGADQNLYAGGAFTNIGATSRGRGAAFTASGTLQSWNPNLGGQINALLHDSYTAKVYVGGAFSTGPIGCASCTRFVALADQSGATANAFMPYAPANSDVYSLAQVGNRLYLGGNFTTLSSAARICMGELNLSSATPLTAFNPSPNGYVNAIAYHGGNLYVGGSFTTIGVPARSYFGILDQATGTLVATSPAAAAEVRAIYAQPGFVAVGGNFSNFDASRYSYHVSIRPAATVTFNGTSTNTATPSHTRTISPSATETSTRTSTNTPTYTATPTNTATPTYTRTMTSTWSASPTLSESATITETFSESPTGTDTRTASPTRTLTHSATQTGTRTETPTRTETGTLTNSATDTATRTASPSSTETPTYTASPSFSSTPTESFSATESATATPSRTITGTSTATPTFTETGSFTSTRTVTATSSETPTSTESPVHTATSSVTPTHTRTVTTTDTDTQTQTSTTTPSRTTSSTQTPTISYTWSATATITPTLTRTITTTDTNTQTATQTSTATQTPTRTGTGSPSFTASVTPSFTSTVTTSFTITISSTATPSSTRTATESATSSPSATQTNTRTATPTYTATPSHTGTASPSATISNSRTATESATLTASPTETRTSTASPTATETVTATVSPTPSHTRTASPSATESATLTASITASGTRTASPTLTASASSTPSPTITQTLNPVQQTQTVVAQSFTPTQAFLAAPAGGPPVVLAPSVAKRGSAICLASLQPTSASNWEVYNTAPQLVSRLSFNGGGGQCMQTANLATGTYYARITTVFAAGGTDVRTIKIIIVP